MGKNLESYLKANSVKQVVFLTEKKTIGRMKIRINVDCHNFLFTFSLQKSEIERPDVILCQVWIFHDVKQLSVYKAIVTYLFILYIYDFEIILSVDWKMVARSYAFHLLLDVVIIDRIFFIFSEI